MKLHGLVKQIFTVVRMIIVGGMITLFALSAVANANPMPEGWTLKDITPEIIKMVNGMTRKQQEKFWTGFMETVVIAHNDVALQIGIDLGAEMDACRVPLNSWEDFLKYAEYRFEPTINHIIDHYLAACEKIYNRAFTTKERNFFYKFAMKYAIQGFQMEGMVEEKWEQIRIDCKRKGI